MKNALFMAEFVSRTTVDPDLKRGWTDLRDYVKVLQQNADNAKQKMDSISKAANIQNQKLVAKNESLLELKAQPIKSTTNQKEIEKLRQDIEATKKAYDEIIAVRQKVLESATNEIGIKQVIPELRPSSAQYEVVYNADRWAGIGYFNQITGDVRVYVDDFSKNESLATVRISVSDKSSVFKVAIGQTIAKEEGDTKVTLTINDYMNMGRIMSLNKEVSYHIKVEKKK